jgi:DNA repair photolyase
MEPTILSVSRREDIPAFKPKWFIDTLKVGYIDMSGAYQNTYRINFDNVKFIVFWTKNPHPLIKYLDEIQLPYYFQFTLNYYPEYELNVPSIGERIATFINLSNLIGKEKVIWRFDPIIVNDRITKEQIIKRIGIIGELIHPYTEKLIFSFIDPYKKLKESFTEIDNETKIKIAESIIEFNKKWNLKIATCAEGIDLDGIEHGKCIDPELISRICGNEDWIDDKKDKAQRLFCGCIISGDIGTFKECKHKCLYCYAQ